MRRLLSQRPVAGVLIGLFLALAVMLLVTALTRAWFARAAEDRFPASPGTIDAGSRPSDVASRDSEFGCGLSHT